MSSDVPTPEQWMRLALKTSNMMVESQAVITMRTLGVWGLWPLSQQENSRMLVEKLEAMAESQAAMVKAALKGASAASVAEAGLAPIGRRTKANVARLAAKAQKG